MTGSWGQGKHDKFMGARVDMTCSWGRGKHGVLEVINLLILSAP